MQRFYLSFLVMGILCACHTQNNAPEYELLPPSEFQALIKSDKNLQLLDVRTPGEFNEGKLEGAQNIDIHSPDFEERLKAMDKDKTYGVYCAVGARSAAATERMKQLGFKKIFELKGGYVNWVKQLEE